MKRYKCNKCKRVYYECDLVKSKCSENVVGAYISCICPKCIYKGDFVELVEIKEEHNEA